MVFPSIEWLSQIFNCICWIGGGVGVRGEVIQIKNHTSRWLDRQNNNIIVEIRRCATNTSTCSQCHWYFVICCNLIGRCKLVIYLFIVGYVVYSVVIVYCLPVPNAMLIHLFVSYTLHYQQINDTYYKDIEMLINKLINLHQPIQLQQGTSKSKVVKYSLLCWPETPVHFLFIAALQGVLHNIICMYIVYLCSWDTGVQCFDYKGILLSGVACAFLQLCS